MGYNTEELLVLKNNFVNKYRYLLNIIESKMTKKKIKPRLIADFSNKENEGRYSDGKAEDELLELFNSENPRERIEKILSSNPSWPMRIHLSPMRSNLLSWYPFEKEGSLLEIGSGCGALTELFCKKLKKVAAVELTQKRAEITAFRCRDIDNLKVYVGNLHNIKLKEKFDYVTSIGVLEYAGRFTDSKNPFLDFILKLKSYLKNNGTLVIAIENKFGLKYWSGAKEDHTRNMFDSIEGYPDTRDIQTFGKKELSGLLEQAGFKNIDFFYPLPDYKFPIEIFSDGYLPSIHHNVRVETYPYVDLSEDRTYLFNERLVNDNIIVNDQFDFFANSFLVFAN